MTLSCNGDTLSITVKWRKKSLTLDQILKSIEKPARYTGGEWNSIVKEDAELRVALCFPDVYEIGMSHLGSHILYHALNLHEEFACERAYAPWPDMEKALRGSKMPLYALESGRPLNEFDIIGFSLLYELCYTNILTMLELSGLPLYSRERAENMPLVIAGGPCVCNPEPVYAIMDAVLFGDGEELIVEAAKIVLQAKKEGKSRHDTLLMLAQVEGVYVPSFYEARYDENDRFICLDKTESAVPDHIQRRVVMDIDAAPYLGKPVVPNTGIVHDRAVLELFRGCTRGCRFCQAGYIYRPVRERGHDTLVNYARELLCSTGYDELSLFSLSSSDYSGVHELVTDLLDEFEGDHVSLSLPSLRVDSLLKDDLERMQSVRKSGLTLAPEAGTQRLRDVINKNVTEDDLIRSVTDAFSAGWTGLKLYFMIGLPTETDEDILGIADLARKVSRAFYALPKENRKQPLRLTVSASSFVPKPFTPFQWVAQDTTEELLRKQHLLKGALKGIRGVEYKYHSSDTSALEAAFSRGDRRICSVLIDAYKLGCRFDSWAEHYKPDAWKRAFEMSGLSIAEYANRERELDEPLPWDHMDMLVEKRYLVNEYKSALLAEMTRDCRTGCNRCFGDKYADNCPVLKGR